MSDDMITGEWWIDTRKPLPRPYTPPEHTVAGVLHVEGLVDWRLETIGSLIEGVTFRDLKPPAVDGPQTIWGTGMDAEKYSLLGAQHIWSSSQGSNVRGGSQQWHVGSVATSSHAWVAPDDLLDRVNINFRHLRTWLIGTDTNDIEHDEETLALVVSTKRHRLASSINGRRIEARWGVEWEEETNSAGNFLTVKPFAVIDLLGGLPVSELQEWLWPLADLLSFFAMRPCVVDAVHGQLAASKEEIESNHGVRLSVDMRFPQAFHDQRAIETADAAEIVGKHKMLVTREDLEGLGFDFDRVLSAFFDSLKTTSVKTSLGYLLESQEKQRSFTFENMFLAAFKGIETLQPRLSDVRGGSRQVLEDFMSICGETAREIRQAHPEVVSALLDGRNAAAHPRSMPPGVHDQINLLNTTQWLLRHGLLQVLGLDKHACDTIITNNIPFKEHLYELQQRDRQT